MSMGSGATEVRTEPTLSGLRSILRYAKQPLKRFEDARAFSNRATAFELFGVYHLMIFDPELIETVLIAEHASFGKDAFVRDLEKVLGNGLLNSEGQVWRRQRKLAAPSFQRSEIAAYGEQMVDCARRFLLDVESGQPIDVHAGMMHLTLDILVKTLFGAEVSRVAEVEQALDGVMREYTPLAISLRNGLPDWLTFASRRRIAQLRTALDSVVLDLIAAKTRSPSPGTDLLSRLIASTDAEGGLSHAELRHQTMTLFLAGHETTALVLTYALRLLSLHPQVAARARREVADVIGERAPSVADLPELAFTRAVLDETLRLFPPAWALARLSLRDCVIGDLTCKADTQVVLALDYAAGSAFFQPSRAISARTLVDEARAAPLRLHAVRSGPARVHWQPLCHDRGTPGSRGVPSPWQISLAARTSAQAITCDHVTPERAGAHALRAPLTSALARLFREASV
jgi:cytochrome P450